MKLIKVKAKDARPGMRVKAAGNVFVEIYKDGRGFFYKIDIPGKTGYESKERFQDQNKALNAGTAHAKRFIATVKGKVGDAENSKLRDLLERDVDRFTTSIYNGEGWILKGDIVEQFHRFTNQIWHDPLLDKDQLNKKVVSLVEADVGVEVFNTLTEARKAGYDL